MAIVWSLGYSVGVKEIDNQHKKLVKIIERLFKSINEMSTKKSLKKILNDLAEFAVYHFETEEKYFKKFKYAGSKSHIKEHERFKKKVSGLIKRFDEDKMELSFELIDYLENWLLHHLQYEDQKYVQCFSEHGLK